MSAASKPGVDIVAIKMKSEPLRIGHNRQGRGGCRRRNISADTASGSHTNPDVVMGKNGHTCLAEVFVPAAVIIMPMRIDQIFDWRRAKSGDSGSDLIG